MHKKGSAVLRSLLGVALIVFSVAMTPAAQAQAGGTSAPVVTGLTIGQIGFSVENLDRVTDWYVKMLGFKVVRTATPEPGFTVRTLRIPGFAIDLVKKDGSALATWPYDRYKQQGYVHFAFYTTEIDAALKALQAAGADVEARKGANGAYNRLILHDPEGNEFELFNPPAN